MADEQPIRGLDPETLHAWERQRGETAPAWAAFQAYRDLPPEDRSMLAAYKQVKQLPRAKKVPASWRRWFVGYDWQERALAYDRYQDDYLRAKLESRRLQARLDTAELGALLRQKAADAAGQLTTDSKLSPTHVARLAKVGAELEMLALGEPTGRIALVSDADLNAAIQYEMERLSGKPVLPGGAPPDASAASPDDVGTQGEAPTASDSDPDSTFD